MAIPLAIVMTSFAPGGTERQMIELVRRLDPERWSVHVACFHTRGGWFNRVAPAASVSVFPVRSFRRPVAFSAQLWAFARWCQRMQIAVAHTVDMPANIFGLTGAAMGRVPVRIANRREIDPGRTIMKLALQRMAYGFAHAIIANSRAAADRLYEERVPAQKVTIIQNGLDIESIQPSFHRRSLRRVVAVANLRPEKGHDVLIAAAAVVLRRFPDVQFQIVGDGPDRERLLARAISLGVAPSFTFAGHCDDVAAQLRSADVFVLPSRSEALPNAALEAMAAGLPIVASDVGGVPELITHEKTGLLVRAGDPRGLADALCRLMDDPAFARRLGIAARLVAAGHQSFDGMVAAFEAVYVAELAERGRR